MIKFKIRNSKFKIQESSISGLKSAIRNPHSTSGTGFTLLELVIALGISSIIFLVIVSTYSSTMNTLEKWDRREEDYYLARNIFRRMHSEVSSLYSISDSQFVAKSASNPEAGGSELEGDEKFLSFYTTAESLYFPFSCLMRVTYEFITSDEGENLLIREEEPLVNFSLEETINLKSYVWSEDLKDLSFQYSDGESWYDSWNPEEKDKMLRAIKIILISPHEETFSTIIYIPTKI